MDMRTPDVTAIIPVHNRADALRTVFPSYGRSARVRRVVLVDDASTDATPQVMRDLAASSPVPVDIVRNAQRSLAQGSRNRGLRLLDTDWALMGEDDVYLSADYVEVLQRQADEIGADIIGGRLVNVPVRGEFAAGMLKDVVPDTPPGSVFNLSLFSMEFSAKPAQPISTPFLHSVVLVRRHVFEHVIYDPWYKGNGVREETDFYLSAGAAGFRIFFSPDTVCFHLRGAVANRGGQRMSRFGMEVWNLINTHHLVSKHWAYLARTYRFRGSPLLWMAKYIWRRYTFVARHIVGSRTLQPKNRL
jgi:GT2 family glycosyltransferase